MNYVFYVQVVNGSSGQFELLLMHREKVLAYEITGNVFIQFERANQM